MTLRAPAIQWPATFDAFGPADDPAILLAGEAKVAGIGYVVTAVRMRRGMRMPDYKDGVSPGAYEDALDTMLDEIECLASTREPALLPLADGHYLLWMVPAARD